MIDTSYRGTRYQPIQSGARPETIDLPNRERWRNDAACLDGPDLFFAPSTEERRAVTRICRGCPVRAECARAALDGAEQWGVWGGIDLESHERRSRIRHLVKIAGGDR